MKYDKKINDSLIKKIAEANINRWIEDAKSGMIMDEFDDDFLEKTLQDDLYLDDKVCSWIKGSNEILIRRDLYRIIKTF